MKLTHRKLLVLCGLLIAVGTFFGFKRDTRNFEISKNLNIFNSVFRELDICYVDTVDPEKSIEAGINYMLSQLDPYTVYYPESKNEELKMMTTGKFAGIGSIIRFHKGKNHVVIDAPYEGMAAQKAGLKPGDVLLEIDGEDLTGMTTQQVSDRLRGEPGTSFMLKYERPGLAEPQTVKVTRENVQTPAVPYYGMLKDHVGYIVLSSFFDGCSRDVRRAFIELKEQGARALVLDLRGNPGGLMNEAVDLLSMFIPKGTEVVSTKGKLKQASSVSKTGKEPLDLDIPIAVLVNENSASASEIVAGSLQDLDRAVIIGERTFGKGLVQVIRDLPYGGSLKVTTSKYYIPSGRCVQAINYQQRTADGKAERIPDSLTHVFHTADGRPVRDGGGVTPDVTVEDPKLPTMLFYLANDDVLFDYATDYCLAHPTIAAPEDFEVTDADYADFKARVKKADFKYDRESEKALKALKEIADVEGYTEDAKAEFEALEKKLTHNLDRDLDHFAKDIKMLIANEIVTRYYYQRGAIIQQLKDDNDVDKAVNILTSPTEYRKILSAPADSVTAKTVATK